MAGDKTNTVFYGTFIHSKKLDELEFLHSTAVFVDKDGKIVAVERDCDPDKAAAVFPRLGWEASNVSTERIKEGQFFFPGFIGEFYFLLFYLQTGFTDTSPRHSPARLAIPQRRHFR
jgi:hypothetical protein